MNLHVKIKLGGKEMIIPIDSRWTKKQKDEVRKRFIEARKEKEECIKSLKERMYINEIFRE